MSEISADGLGNIVGNFFNPNSNKVTINGITKELTTSARGGLIPFYTKDFNLVSGAWYYVQVSSGTQLSNSYRFYVASGATPTTSATGAITLDSSTCTILAGQSQCGSKISWNVTNGVPGKTEFIIAGGFNYTIFQDTYTPTTFMNKSGENVSTYTLKNNGVVLDTKTVTSKCATGSTWNGSVCAQTVTTTNYPVITEIGFTSDNSISIIGNSFSTLNNTVSINGISKILPSSANTVSTLTSNGLVTSTNGLIIKSSLSDFNLLLGGNYSVTVVSDSKTSNSYNFTVPSAMPSPVATLTISASGYGTNVHDITYPVGTPNTKNWSSGNGATFSSVAWRTGTCTNRTNGDATEVWQANTSVGSSNGIGNAGDVGCVVHIKYTVTNAAGSASDQVNVTVTAASVATPTGAITVDSPTCIIPAGSSQCGSKLSWNVSGQVPGKTEFIVAGGFNYTIFQDTYTPTTFMNKPGENVSAYTLKNNGVTLDTKTVTSKCATGSTWNGSVCVVIVATPSVPAPTASLTISASGYGTNVRDITYPVGTANTKNWTSTNGASYSSVAWRTGSCTNRANGDATEVWQANSVSGVSNGIGNAGDIGCVVHIKYTVTNSVGSATDQVNVTVTAASVATSTGAITVDSPTASFKTSPKCIIKVGESGCSGVPISWTSSGVTTIALTDATPSLYTTTGPGAQNSTVYVPISGGTYQLRNGSVSGNVLATVTGTASCAAGSTWNGGVCAGGTQFPAVSVSEVTGTIKATVQALNTTVVNVTNSLSGATAVSALSCTNLGKNLHRGNETDAVTMLQIFLVEKGFLKEKPSGFFGDLTIAAVKAYQRSLGIKETGMVYDVTREAIKQETCGI
jgi:hypothetical protein